MGRAAPSTTYGQDGNLVTSGLWNTGPKALNDFMANRPTFRGTQSLITTSPNNAWTAARLDTTLIDTDGGHNTIVNNSKYACQIPGWYWAKGTIGWNGSGTFPQCRSDCAIAVNGGTVVGSSQFMAFGPNTTGAFTASALVYLFSGDYVEVWGRQNSGLTLTFDNNSTGNTCDLNLWRIGS